MRKVTSWVVAVAVAAAVVLTGGGPAHASYNPMVGSEPTLPYPQPDDPDVPRRGCATIASTPSAPPSASIPAVQVIYAWHASNGNNYAGYDEAIAKMVDRLDWSLDNSTNYDQHVNFSCSYTPGASYADYAAALVHPVEITAGSPPVIDPGTVRSNLVSQGYDDDNRYYLIFTDFDSGADAWGCSGLGGLNGPSGNLCSAVLDEWDSGIALHELTHVFGAAHAWSKEDGGMYNADVMGDLGNYWILDQDFNTYYDPSELSATFYTEEWKVVGGTNKDNIADHPALTTPVCCDVGASNDLLTAQERTIEADAPWATPTGFTITGGGWAQVTPECGRTSVSCYYYDGRRSLTMNVQSHAEGKVAITSRKAVTAGEEYKFFARIRSSDTGTVKLRLSWYDSGNTLISVSDSGTFGMATNWPERSFTAVAPTGATQVEASVVSPAGQTFTYQLDTLQLNHCDPDCRASV